MLLAAAKLPAPLPHLDPRREPPLLVVLLASPRPLLPYELLHALAAPPVVLPVEPPPWC